MDLEISVIKGTHPGVILAKELKSRNLKKGRFALSIDEFPQIISDITKEKRRMNPALSLKIEQALGLEEGFFMVLQAYYDIEQEKMKQTGRQPDLSKIRQSLFWDVEIKKIDWEKNKSTVIKRIFERGNEQEVLEIIDFYGKEIIEKELYLQPRLLPRAEINKNKYLK